jgi:hypothetical protein
MWGYLLLSPGQSGYQRGDKYIHEHEVLKSDLEDEN